MKKIVSILLVICMIIPCISYGEPDTQYIVADYAVKEEVRNRTIEAVLSFYGDEYSMCDILTVIRQPNQNEHIILYDVLHEERVVARITAMEFNGEWDCGLLSITGETITFEEQAKAVTICQYDYINHHIIGEEKTKTLDISLDDYVLNDVKPLVQVDKYGVGRNWCFLSAMGMIINLFENEDYKTYDIADKYLNKFEVNRTEMNDEGYISNSAEYRGNTDYNIRFALQYRGIKANSTLPLTFNRIKPYIDNNGTALLIFNRVYRELDEYGNIIEPDYSSDNTDNIINKHSVVVLGYNPKTQDILIADPSPREEPPGPYNPDIIKLTNQNNTYYIPYRTSVEIDGVVKYKVYKLDSTFYYNRNVFDTFTIPIQGQEIKQLSAFACIASIINKVENLNINTEDVARMLLPIDVVNKLYMIDENIFSKYLGTNLDAPFVNTILSLRGYTVSDKLSFITSKAEYIQANMDLGYGIGIVFDVYDTNNKVINTHFALVDSVNIESNKLKIMDPSGSGSYKLIEAQSKELIDAPFYGVGFKMKPTGIYKYKIGQEK